MDLEPWDVADPSMLIEQISRKHRLTAGLALLAVVEDPSAAQRLVHVGPLAVDSRHPDCPDLSDLLCDAISALPFLPDSQPIRHTTVTVLVRPGFAVPGQSELQWLLGWRYSNHFARVFDGDLILVTEHGWFDHSSGWGGHAPRMEP